MALAPTSRRLAELGGAVGRLGLETDTYVEAKLRRTSWRQTAPGQLQLHGCRRRVNSNND